MRARSFLAAALLAVGSSGVFVAYDVSHGEPDQIALVNDDAGPIGNRIVEALRPTGRFLIEEDSNSANRSRYAARIVLPGDLTNAVSSVTSGEPRRARLEVLVDPDADSARVDNALEEVTSHIRIEGVRETLATVRAARDLIGQASLTTRVLRAGVNDAADTSERFRADADHMLASLTQAKRRATEIQTRVDELNTMVDELGSRLERVSTTLDKTGVTVGHLVDGAMQVSAGLNQAVPALRSLPFAHDPALAPIIANLEALQDLAQQTGDQVYGFADLAGIAVGPATRVSTLVRDGVVRLSSARDELKASVAFARQVPKLADEGARQLIAAQRQLDDGLGKMRTVLGNLDQLTSDALSALPEPGRDTQAIAAIVDNPVEIERKNS
jgi:putative membrane protein